MKKYIIIFAIISSATLTQSNHSIAQDFPSNNQTDQSTRGLINDIICFYEKGFFYLKCWVS